MQVESGWEGDTPSSHLYGTPSLRWHLRPCMSSPCYTTPSFVLFPFIFIQRHWMSFALACLQSKYINSWHIMQHHLSFFPGCPSYNSSILLYSFPVIFPTSKFVIFSCWGPILERKRLRKRLLLLAMLELIFNNSCHDWKMYCLPTLARSVFRSEKYPTFVHC